MFRTVSLVAGLAAFIVAGCGTADKGPKVVTFPVTGTVVDAGGKPVSGGQIGRAHV